MSIFTHVCVGANDIAQATAFYDAVLAPLGIKQVGNFGPECINYGREQFEFLVLKPRDGQPASSANGGTIGFVAPDKAAVEAFHAAGLANGGTDEGEPGPRFDGAAYAAYMRDPTGNKICAYVFSAS